METHRIFAEILRMQDLPNNKMLKCSFHLCRSKQLRTRPILSLKMEILIQKSNNLNPIFSVTKATLQSQMSVRPFVRQSAKPLNSLKSSSFIFNFHRSTFIIHHSSFFIHPSSFFVHPSSFFINPSSFLIHPSSFFLHFATFKLFSLFFYLF